MSLLPPHIDNKTASEVEELLRRTKALEKNGYMLCERKGHTAVGHEIEVRLGIEENNLRTSDFGNVEVKSKRASTSSNTTLFCQNFVWLTPFDEVIKNYGAPDRKSKKTRLSFFRAFIVGKPQASTGLILEVSSCGTRLELLDQETRAILAYLPRTSLDTGLEKIQNIYYVNAESIKDKDKRESIKIKNVIFYGKIKNFWDSLIKGKAKIEFRASLPTDKDYNPTGEPKTDKGTAFRVSDAKIKSLYEIHNEIYNNPGNPS